MGSSAASIKFGTDGWRAVIAEDFTFANVRAVAQATADYFRRRHTRTTRRRMVVGYDRRFLSPQFAEAVAEVLAGNGFEVNLTSTGTPTPHSMPTSPMPPPEKREVEARATSLPSRLNSPLVFLPCLFFFSMSP